jgi:hypothetical protein
MMSGSGGAKGGGALKDPTLELWLIYWSYMTKQPENLPSGKKRQRLSSVALHFAPNQNKHS